MESPVTPSRIEYINNPFTIAVRGLNLLFLHGQNVAILLIILAVLNYLPNANRSAPSQAAAPSLQSVFAALPIIITTGVVVLAALLVITAVINGICGYTTARIARGGTVTLSETIKAVFSRFGDVLWLQFLQAVKLLGWTLLGIVPGVIMAIRYNFAMTLLFDKNLTGNAAIKQSVALTRRSWITTFAALTVFNVITFSIISLLVQTASSVILYRQFSATPNDERPAPHGLSVAALVLTIITIVITILGIAALVGYGATHGWFQPSGTGGAYQKA